MCRGFWDEPLAKKNTNFAVIPYTLANSQVNKINNTPVSNQVNIGGDAKISVGPALNLDLTVNRLLIWIDLKYFFLKGGNSF
jgi:hypothetical protein